MEAPGFGREFSDLIVSVRLCETMHVSLHLLLLILGLDIAFGLSANKSPKLKKKSFASAVFSKNQSVHANKTASCEWLHRLKHQSKLCWRRRGLAAVLHNARKLSVKSCEEHFKFSQWNCTQRGRFFRRTYRETALMQSLSAAALAFGVARACREGRLAGCKCGGHPAAAPNSSDWHWGDCADNTRFAKTFARKFLQLKKKNADLQARLARHNSDVGIRLVARSVEVACRCHGVSGSCAVKICFRKMKPFAEISRLLVDRYHSAIQVSEGNTADSLRATKRGGKLMYLEPSPNFCPLTAGRRCSDPDNCATLCCARGHYEDTEPLVEYCNCRFPPASLDLTCDTCRRNQTVLRCK